MNVPNPVKLLSPLYLIGILVDFRADSDIVKSNVEVLVKEGLGERAEGDFILAKDTCHVLLKMAKIKVGSCLYRTCTLTPDANPIVY